ncbi:hypothetical protein [Oceanobacillus sp. FSL H7-0719]|uniref:hypothetical protein n=1 Tax=Oceanobacillus sp. FSL H7-0719 TaxID=2954507 RepID=UPI00325682CE
METKFNTDDLFEYYKNQIFKMLGLFESKDEFGYKVGIRIKSELEQMPQQFNSLYGDYRYNRVVSKIDVLIDELFMLDGEHQFVKNHVMETMNLLDEIKEGMK